MRVVMVNRADAFTFLGGDTIQMVKTKESLERLGISVDIALGPQPRDFYASFDVVHIFNIQTYTFSYYEAQKAKQAGKPVALSPVFWDFLNSEEVLNMKGYWSPKLQLVSKVLGKVVTEILLKAYWSKWKSKQMQKFMLDLLKMADILLPNSEAEMDCLRKNFKLGTGATYEVIPNAVDISIFNPYQELPIPDKLTVKGITSKKYILEVGRIDPCKNQLSLIKAAINLKLPLVLIGAETNNAYTQECKKVSTGHEVFFIGPVAHEELSAYYCHARVHALPSWRETPGLASLEAAAMGCNIVSTFVGSGKEYFGSDAWYCDPFNQESIIEAVRNAYYSQTNSFLIECVRQNYSWVKAGERTLQAYKRATELTKGECKMS